MKKTLVIMAAGLGSRFGGKEGQKQVTPVDGLGQMIIDYSVFDARRAGFEKVVYVIKPESLDAFHEGVGGRWERFIEVAYAFQTPQSYLPDGFAVPEGRVKPWGTGHAALCAEKEVPDGFVCINADDFYGREAYERAAAFLDGESDETLSAMVGYRLRNTMTPNGSVARGVCETDENGYLTTVTERTKISQMGADAVFTENDKDFYPLSGDSIVSLNFWIFKRSVFGELEKGFHAFLKDELSENPLKKEYYLPSLPQRLIKENKARFRVLPTKEKWFGLTYQADVDKTRRGIQQLKDMGVYPDDLFGGSMLAERNIK
ncbi:MAG: NTP transferase domain-containing protein [Clostridiales bacterium]|nr:NTP transferase domain-containing protein [Clostridiales bacterium]